MDIITQGFKEFVAVDDVRDSFGITGGRLEQLIKDALIKKTNCKILFLKI